MSAKSQPAGYSRGQVCVTSRSQLPCLKCGLISHPERQGEGCMSTWSTLSPWLTQQSPKLTSRSEPGDIAYSNQELSLLVQTSSKNTTASANQAPSKSQLLPNLRESVSGEGSLTPALSWSPHTKELSKDMQSHPEEKGELKGQRPG